MISWTEDVGFRCTIATTITTITNDAQKDGALLY